MNEITVRRPDFDLDREISCHWLGGDAFRSQVFNSLSMMFPCGEQYFIDALRRVATDITEPALREEIRGFIGQEAIHRQVHAKLNREMERQGLRNLAEPMALWRIHRSRSRPALDHLAITAGYEHFTAIFGEAVLRDDSWLDGAPPNLRALWIWHAIEEVEHKAVSVAAYHALGGGYGRRIGWYLYATLFFLADVTVQTLYNLHRSGRLWRGRTWLHGARFMLGRRGVVWVVLHDWFAYLRPGYLPRHGATLDKARSWLAENSGWFG